MRPANTDTLEAGPSRSASTTQSIWVGVKMAVTLSCTPAATRLVIKPWLETRKVLVTGIFTNTLGAHWAMRRACFSISSWSSEKTSKEMGRSVTTSSTWRAKRS